MNLSWLTGTLSEEEMRDEHPLELEAIEAVRQDESRTEGASPGGTASGGPSAADTSSSKEGGPT
jgi:hypothetical protein